MSRPVWTLYGYPGEYTRHDRMMAGGARIAALHVDYETVQGAGNARGFATGVRFKLTKYPRQDQNWEYLILAADYQFQSDAFGSSGAPNTGPVFQCWFTALSSPTHHPPQTRIQGPQTAIVVGKSGEELWTDQYGQVKVQFHWDYYANPMNAAPAGYALPSPGPVKNWGAVAIPHIGQEVIVDFLESKPDRPIITGRVYNGINKPPYGLPPSAVISRLMSNSTKGDIDYNKYVMDDTKGKELLREHGQFDKDSTIEHDLREHVLNDCSQDVTNNETIRVGKDCAKNIGVDWTETVGANKIINIAQTRTRTVGVNETVNVGGQQAVTVGRSQSVAIGDSLSEKSGQSRDVTIGTTLSENVGTDWSETVGKNHSLSLGEKRSGSIGKDDSLKVGKDLVIDAGDSGTIKTGKASITMKQDGPITIQGKDITVKGSGSIDVKASKNVVIKGKKVLEN